MKGRQVTSHGSQEPRPRSRKERQTVDLPASLLTALKSQIAPGETTVREMVTALVGRECEQSPIPLSPGG